MSEFSLEKKLYRWRVRAGFLGIIVTIIIAKPSLLSLLTAMGICSLALILRTWAAGHLKKEKELTISGPYQYSRNPLYLGNVIIGISVVIGAPHFGCSSFLSDIFSFSTQLLSEEKMSG